MTTIILDVNETLLDLAPVQTFLDERYGGLISANDWFRELLRLSFVSATTDVYVPFTELAAHALDTTTAPAVGRVRAEDRQAVAEVLSTLPPHPDVVTGLAALSDAGARLAALTNSPLATVRAQLDNAGIAEYFDRIMSVEMVQRFKPHRTVYLTACRELDVEPSEATMVAAHDWDIAGARSAGLHGIFVARPGQSWSPAFPKPDAVVPDIPAAAAWVLGS